MSDRYDEVMKEALDMARPSRTPWVLFVLSVAAAGGLAFFLLRQRDRAQAEIAAAQGAVVDLRSQVQEARTARAELEQRLDKLESERAGLLASKDELSRDVAAKDEELTRLKSTYDELQEKMKAEIAKGDVRLSQANGRLKVDLVDAILFDSGEAAVSKRGEEVLARVGAVLARIDDKQVQVSGHTDDAPISSRLEGRYPTNWELSAARATNVVRFLEDRAHVPGRRLVAAAHGPYEPITSNATPSGRARNRRIEILLTPALEAAPAKVAAAAPGAAAPERASAVRAPGRAPAKAAHKKPARRR